MNKSKLALVFGLLCYSIPEIAVIFKQENVWIGVCTEAGFCNLSLDPIPFSGFALFTDRYLPAFYLFAVPALFLLFYSINELKSSSLDKTVLSSLITLSVFFALPNLMWWNGDVYYETLDFYMGQISLILMFFTILLFYHRSLEK